jgi:hypothetical protein
MNIAAIQADGTPERLRAPRPLKENVDVSGTGRADLIVLQMRLSAPIYEHVEFQKYSPE